MSATRIYKSSAANEAVPQGAMSAFETPTVLSVPTSGGRDYKAVLQHTRAARLEQRPTSPLFNGGSSMAATQGNASQMSEGHSSRTAQPRDPGTLIGNLLIITITDGWVLLTGDAPYVQGRRVIAASSGTAFFFKTRASGADDVEQLYLREGNFVDVTFATPSRSIRLTPAAPYACIINGGQSVDGPRMPSYASEPVDVKAFMSEMRDAVGIGRGAGLTLLALPHE